MPAAAHALSDEAIEKALDYLVSSATEAAQARANRVHIEEYRKSLKGMIQVEHADQPIGRTESLAYSDQRYTDHLDGLKQAVYEDERFRNLRIAAQARIEAWRTWSANQRVGP